MLRYLTSGESHGRALVTIIEGLPAGLAITEKFISGELSRRQMGWGRSSRMKIEKDTAEILSGTRNGVTIGSPLCVMVRNRAAADWENLPPITEIRPGHADLAGSLKYGHRDARNVLERSSARETAARVAAGAAAKRMLAELDVRILSHVIQIGKVRTSGRLPGDSAITQEETDSSPVRCLNPDDAGNMMAEIDRASEKGDTLGGTFEVAAFGLPPGLGSYAHWDRKLDGALARAVMSIQAIKGVEIGLGFGYAEKPGSEVQDAPFYEGGRFRHLSNNAGGIEGGVTNGEPVILRAVMKPIPTLTNPLESVDLATLKKTRASVQRSDVCAVAAASVIAESAVAIELAKCFQEKFGSDTMDEIKRNLKSYTELLP